MSIRNALFRIVRSRSPVVLLPAALLVDACAPRTTPRARAEVRVLVYNIHAGKDARGVDNLVRVAELIRASRADVVLLQEVDVNTQRSGRVDQPKVLVSLTGMYAAFGKTLDYQGGQYGLAILSRWPMTSDTLVHLPIDPPQARAGGSYEPRGALRVVIASPHGKLIAINTHLDASRDDQYRRQEVRAVLALSDSARLNAEAHVIVGGDFNSTPESDVQAVVRQSPMRDVWPLCGSGEGLTYPADSAVKRIDYLYIERRAGCDEARVLATDASDHRPLLVVLKLHPR